MKTYSRVEREQLRDKFNEKYKGKYELKGIALEYPYIYNTGTDIGMQYCWETVEHICLDSTPIFSSL